MLLLSDPSDILLRAALGCYFNCSRITSLYQHVLLCFGMKSICTTQEITSFPRDCSNRISQYIPIHNIRTTNSTEGKILFRISSKPTKTYKNTHVPQGCSSCHDGSLVDRHCILGIVCDDGMSRLVVSSDGFVFLINFYTSALRPLKR